jgi:hypothetical protein
MLPLDDKKPKTVGKNLYYVGLSLQHHVPHPGRLAAVQGCYAIRHMVDLLDMIGNFPPILSQRTPHPPE